MAKKKNKIFFFCPDKDFGVQRAKNLVDCLGHYAPDEYVQCNCGEDSEVCTSFFFWEVERKENEASQLIDMFEELF